MRFRRTGQFSSLHLNLLLRFRQRRSDARRLCIRATDKLGFNRNHNWLCNGSVSKHDHMSSISARSSSFVLPSLFGDDPEARPLYPQQTSDRRQSVDRISV